MRFVRRKLTVTTLLTVFSILPILFPDSDAARNLQSYGAPGVLLSEAFK